MKCENKACGRELTPKEPVYRCLVHLPAPPGSYRDHEPCVLHVCGDCAKTRELSDLRGKDRSSYSYRDPTWGNVYKPLRWCTPKLCEHCGRTVIHDSSVAPQITACSDQCRRAIYSASRRR